LREREPSGIEFLTWGKNSVRRLKSEVYRSETVVLSGKKIDAVGETRNRNMEFGKSSEENALHS
jgi:hypothetical protein